jgi:hypothetical protein
MLNSLICHNNMKKLLIVMIIILACDGVIAKSQLFVRVFQLNGEIQARGFVIEATDSSLILSNNTSGNLNINYSNISRIITSRTAGHNVVIGSLLTAFTMGVAGAAIAEPGDLGTGFSSGEGFALGVIFGIPIGAVLGGASALLKNRNVFEINGNLDNWRVFEKYVNDLYESNLFQTTE